MYRLAKDLGLTIEQVLQMSKTEFVGWIAFYKIESQEERKAMNKAKARR